MRIEISKRLGCFNLASPTEKSWSVHLFVEGAGRAVNVSWPEDDEPMTEDQPPSEVVALMRQRVSRYIYWGGKVEAEKTFAFIDTNAALVDAHWARQQAAMCRTQAERLTKRADTLIDAYPMPEGVRQ